MGNEPLHLGIVVHIRGFEKVILGWRSAVSNDECRIVISSDLRDQIHQITVQSDRKFMLGGKPVNYVGHIKSQISSAFCRWHDLQLVARLDNKLSLCAVTYQIR